MFLSPKIANMRSTKALRDYSALAKRQPTPGTLDDWERIFGWISGEKKTPNGLWPFDGVPWVSQRRRPSKRWGREFQLSIIWQVIIYKANKYGWYEKCGSLEVWVGGREIKEKEERQWSGKVWQRGSGAGWPVIHTGQLWCPCGKGKGPISAPTTLHSLLKFHLPRGFRLNWHLAPRFPPLWKSPENMPHNTKVCFFLANMSLSFVSDMLSNIPSSQKYSHLYRVAPTPLLLVKVGFRSSSDVHTKLLEERTRIAFGQSVPRAWACWVGRWVAWPLCQIRLSEQQGCFLYLTELPGWLKATTAVSGSPWHAAGVEVVWAPPGGGDVAGPLPHCWLPSRGLKFIDREEEDGEGGW